MSIGGDIGSGDLFLPGTDCTVNCEGHTLYDPDASSESSDTNTPFSLAFGDGSTVQGTVFRDTVTIAGLTVRSCAPATCIELPKVAYRRINKQLVMPTDSLLGLPSMSFLQTGSWGWRPLKYLSLVKTPSSKPWSRKERLLRPNSHSNWLPRARSSSWVKSMTIYSQAVLPNYLLRQWYARSPAN